MPATLIDSSVQLMRRYENSSLLRVWANSSLTTRIIGFIPPRKGSIIRRSGVSKENTESVKTSSNEEFSNLKKAEKTEKFSTDITSKALYNIDKGLEELSFIEKTYNIPVYYVWTPTKDASLYKRDSTNTSNTYIQKILELQKVSKNYIKTQKKDNFFVDLDELEIPIECFVDIMHTVNSCSKIQADFIIEKTKLKQ